MHSKVNRIFSTGNKMALFGGLKIRIFLVAILDLCKLQELSKVDSLSFKPDWFYDTRKGQRNKELHSNKHFEVKVKAF